MLCQTGKQLQTFIRSVLFPHFGYTVNIVWQARAASETSVLTYQLPWHNIHKNQMCSNTTARTSNLDIPVLDQSRFVSRWFFFSKISSFSLPILSSSSCFLSFKCSNWASTSDSSYSAAASSSSVARHK